MYGQDFKPAGRLRVNLASMAHETVDEEVIIINLETGTYYSIVGTGVAVWQAIERGLSRRHLVAAMAKAYGGNPSAVSAAVEAFVDELVREEIVLVEEGGEVAGPVELNRLAAGPFAPPTLAVHTNMSDLLLLDPIHDVNEQGWPNRPTE